MAPARTRILLAAMLALASAQADAQTENITATGLRLSQLTCYAGPSDQSGPTACNVSQFQFPQSGQRSGRFVQLTARNGSAFFFHRQRPI